MIQLIRIFTFSLLIALVMADEAGSGMRNGYKTPKYKVLHKTKTYELREYEATNWVATSGGSRGGMFWRLFRYISGANEDGSKMSMTTPVAIKIEAMEGTSQKYTMHFFLPESKNPEPTNDDVSLVSFPKLKVYVRSYGGYTSDTKEKEAIEALMADVGKDNYDASYYFFSGYDAPFNMFNRHNEVWLLAKQ